MVVSFLGAIFLIVISQLFSQEFKIFATVLFSSIALYLLYKLGFFIKNFKKFYAERKAIKMFNKYHERNKYRQTGYKIQFGNKLNGDDKRLLRFQRRLNKVLASIY